MPTMIRNTMNPMSTLYFNMQSGSFRKLISYCLSLKHMNASDKLFMLFLSASISVILRVFFPEKILLKLQRERERERMMRWIN